MSGVTQQALVDTLLKRHGLTYAEELGIQVSRNTPSELFQLLCAALLFSARIRSGAAKEAFQALKSAGWITAEKMAASTWEERTRTLNQHGYARYDESTSRMLGETAKRLLDDYAGDLRRLREAAGSKPSLERQHLKGFKGIGEVGADIFCREVQVVWKELYPFADKRALASAARLDLPTQAEQLARLATPADFPRLVDALVRVELAKQHEQIKAYAH
ncbi:hypothetical protein CAI21_16070 [Alkalilimnicola ehrlichii]|uniref:Endonuclease n=1 Tax=Alkalilimnicola ehrlichii TaxID=351052 RepID=A0A3E0WNW6_9GAMM|nr:hypothetical protein [Alkalilimnicola ehrlichii]RFA26798.1 hypothetical protein CAI21_16070 [Alkalilimnicola ehrlichii]RFA33893.1 hypothetical protein CAL65_16190 [Alkalilimnicola ehrlichii]